MTGCLVAAVLMALIGLAICTLGKGRALLEKWADENDFQILQQQTPPGGPARHFHVTIRDRQGNVKSASVRFRGTEPQVEWHDRPTL